MMTMLDRPSSETLEQRDSAKRSARSGWARRVRRRRATDLAAAEEGGLDDGVAELAAQLVAVDEGPADDSHVQVHPTGIRHLRTGRQQEWKAPGAKKIVCA